jgi:hypothetical protein
MPIKINGTNTAANPSITGSDTDTGIVYGSDQIDFSTGGSSKVTLNGSNLGIGTTSPAQILHLSKSSGDAYLRVQGGTNQGTLIHKTDGTLVGGFASGGTVGGGANDIAMRVESGNNMLFAHGTTQRMRLDSSGRLLIATTTVGDSSADNLTIEDSSHCGITIRSGSSSGGNVFFTDATSGDQFQGYVQYNHSDNSLKFGTAKVERVRIVNDGRVRIVCESFASDPSSSNKGVMLGSTNTGSVFSSGSATNTQTHIIFRNGNGDVGTIQTSGSSTAYNTSSDYRLKENAVAISDGITRLKTLKPYRFNFKADADTTVDGFFAHEVTAVPEAISGTKDETKDILYTEEDTIPSGKKVGDVKETVPAYQGIDQSKIVPLLVAALQEAIGRIEALEAA